MTFSEHLKLILTEKQLSQKQLAYESGLTEAAISRYIKGDRVPNTATLLKIAKALQVSADTLLGSSEPALSEIQKAVDLVAHYANNLTKEQKLLIYKALIGY